MFSIDRRIGRLGIDFVWGLYSLSSHRIRARASKLLFLELVRAAEELWELVLWMEGLRSCTLWAILSQEILEGWDQDLVRDLDACCHRYRRMIPKTNPLSQYVVQSVNCGIESFQNFGGEIQARKQIRIARL